MSDDDILMDMIKKHRNELENEDYNIDVLLDSIKEENVGEIAEKLSKYPKNKVIMSLSRLSLLRPTDSQLCAQFLHEIINTPDQDQNGEDKRSWKNVITDYIGGLPIPIIRFLYENKDFTLDEILDKIYDFTAIALADIIPGFYHFAEDFPQVKLSRELIISGCIPGTVCALIKADDVDHVKQMTDSFDENYRIPKPYFEEKFYKYSHYIEKIDRTPLNIAAFYGAVKCFKYFMLIGYEITYQTTAMAVAGGNNEIFRICEQKGGSLDLCDRFAAIFWRFDLMKWLLEVKGEASHVRSNPSSALFTSLDGFNNPYCYLDVEPKSAVMKCIEDGNDFRVKTCMDLYCLFSDIPEENQIPIARALVARGYNPDYLFLFAGSDEFFEYALTVGNLGNLLQEKSYQATNIIGNVGDKVFAKIEELGLLDLLDIRCLSMADKKGEKLYKVISKDPSRLSDEDWSFVISNRHTNCFDLIPTDKKITIDIAMCVKYRKIEETIAMYKSLPPNIDLCMDNCMHPSLFVELVDRISNLRLRYLKFFNFFAVIQRSEKICRGFMFDAREYDVWEIFKEFLKWRRQNTGEK